MNYKYVGNTGMKVSELCFGTMTFGMEADVSESKKMFELARDQGVNFFDTANVYSSGKSEEILGSLIQDCRDEIVVTTKAYFPMGQSPNARGGSRYHLVRAVEDSLRRLKTDRIDIFYLHRIDDNMQLEESLRAIEYLVQQGKILYPAVSNFSAWQMIKAAGIGEKNGWMPICAMQPMYSLVKRQAEVEILPAAKAENIAVFPYNPLAGGLLTGKYFGNKTPDNIRLNSTEMYKTRYMTDEAVKSAKGFVELAKEIDVSPVQLAISWVANHESVTSPLVGARNCEQLAECLKSVNVKMDQELRNRISMLSSEPAIATDRNEERTEARYENITAANVK